MNKLPKKKPGKAPTKPAVVLTNREIAGILREIADHLQRAGDSPFRVAAYRRAAVTVRVAAKELHQILAYEGERGLRELPGIGKSLARSLARLIRKGSSSKLERLRRVDVEGDILLTLPGVGPRLAQRVEESLGANSLEAVFAAAHDGRLRRVPGVGNKRLRAIRESLNARLQAGVDIPYRDGPYSDGPYRDGPHRNRPNADTLSAQGGSAKATIASGGEPPIADLLSIDEEYRAKASGGQLPRATPKLFNPTGRAWLPILHTERNGRKYSAHFANTARSHQLGTFRDWVVIVCESKEHYGQWTVITGREGALRDRRLVVHREEACREYYATARRQRFLPSLDMPCDDA